MIQKTYHLHACTLENIAATLTEVSKSKAYRDASQTLILVLEQNWNRDLIKAKAALTHKILPKAHVVGATHFDNILYSTSETGLGHGTNESTILSFLFFEKTAFTAWRLGLNGSEKAIGQELRHRLLGIEDRKCMLTFFSGGPRDIGLILRDLDVPVVGATAGVQNFFSSGAGAAFVFDEEGVYDQALLAVAFHGTNLHVMTSHSCGWTPVGKTLTVTKLLDPYTVAEIDDKPAADLYEKYLGIPWRRNRLSIANVCEFPLAVEDGGLCMARIPWSWDDEGNLNFAITMHEGEKLRLTYGIHSQVLTRVREDTERYRDFAPEALFMVVCMNRMVFFRDRAHEETDLYRDIVGEAAFMHGNSEIYVDGNAGGEMHSTLVVLGLREGDAEALPQAAYAAEESGDELIPLERRLMTFLRAVTGDLEQATDELIQLKDHLEDEVEIKTRENESLELHVVQTLAEAIDAKDTYTNGHSSRVALYSREIAKRAGYSEKDQNEIYMMGLLHDVGKIGVPDAVINKPGKLTDEEFDQIKQHPAMGSRILANIEEMPKLSTGARWHHERIDGRGYPDGLKDLEIPEEARIIAVADAYDAMTSNRSYRRGMDQERVRDQIVQGKGTQFDPRFADIMLEMIDEDTEFRMREM